MYYNLEAEIVRKNISKEVIAKKINKTYNTLSQKLNGKYPFTYDEALIIQENYFPNIELKELFKRDVSRAPDKHYIS